MKEKRCPMCGNTFPATVEYFYICQGRPSSYCRKCHKYHQAKYEEHKKANRQAMKELREHRAGELRKQVRREVAMKKFDQVRVEEQKKYDPVPERKKSTMIKKEFGAIVRSGTVVDHERVQELRRNILSALEADPDDIWAWRYRRDIGVLLKECGELRKTRDDLVRRIHSLKQGV